MPICHAGTMTPSPSEHNFENLEDVRHEIQKGREAFAEFLMQQIDRIFERQND